MLRSRRGFTLVELLVALAMSGLVLFGTAGLVERTQELSDRVVSLADSSIADAAAADLLFALAARAEVGAGELHAFAGDPREASFPTWCERVGGWIERCRARLGFADGTSGARVLTVAFDANAPIALATVKSTAHFAYLVHGSNGVQTYTTWGDGISRPDAVVIVSIDTLVLPIGAGR